MRIRELQELRYERQTQNLKFSGLSPFKTAKRENISIDDPDEFLSRLKRRYGMLRRKYRHWGRVKCQQDTPAASWDGISMKRVAAGEITAAATRVASPW